MPYASLRRIAPFILTAGLAATLLTSSIGQEPAAVAPVIITRTEYLDLDGDFDQFPDSGETGRLQLTLVARNRDLTGVVAVLVTSDPNVDCIIERSVNLGNLSIGQAVVAGDLDPMQPGFTFKVSDALSSSSGADPARIELCVHIDANELERLSEPTCFSLVGDLDLPAETTEIYIAGPDGVTPSADDGTLLENFDLDRDADGDFTVNDTFRQTDGGTGLTEHGFYLGGSNTPGEANTILGVACGGFWTLAQGNSECILNTDFPMDWHLHCPPGATNCPNIETGTCFGAGSSIACTFDTPTDGQKAISPPNSLHMGSHFSPFDSRRDTTHTRSLQAFVSSPINLAVIPRPGDLELSMFQIARLVDNNSGLGGKNICVDCADVQVQIDHDPDPAVDDWGIWDKLVPYQNVYDHVTQAWSNFASYYCSFTPGDTGTAPPAPSGTHETMCFPQGAWSECGSVRGTDPVDLGDCAGPGVVDPSGQGVWAETRFDLGSFVGQRVRIRWIGSTWLYGIDCYECATDIGQNPYDDGWWLDDITITGVVTAQVSPSADTAPAPGGSCPALCIDLDGDLFGSPGDPLCAGGATLDCDDLHDGIYPGAPELCDGFDNNCDGSVPAVEDDSDHDSWRVCEGDCDDSEYRIYPDAPEVNDGIDNQCPGDLGYGVIDEISGTSYFGSPTGFHWTRQSFASEFLVVRSDQRDFLANCMTFTSTGTVIVDPQFPSLGGAYFYLVRAEAPLVGSWGPDSLGVERTICVP